MPVLTLGEALGGAAQRHPQREALVFEGTRLTYAELDRRTRRLARVLRARGVRRGDVVHLLSLNCPEVLEIYFACAHAGAIMNALNPRSSAGELSAVIRHAGGRVAMVDAELQSALEASGLDLDLIVHRGEPARAGRGRYEALIEHAPNDAVPDGPLSAGSPVLLLYTFKGQGAPLGALLSHENVLWDALSTLTYADLTERDRLLQGMPLHHVAGLHILTIAALLRGMTIVIARQWRADLVCELIERERCTITSMVPAAMRQLLDSPSPGAHDLRSLRTVLSFAGQYDRALFTEALYRLRAGRLLFYYGLTEAGPIVSLTSSTGETLWKENTLGRPVWYLRTRVVRADGGDAAADEPGELWVRGPNVFLGYHRAPLATAQALTEDGWLRTGDLVRADADGCLYLEGRLGAVIKSGGENVDAIEVEKIILECAPELSSAAVVGRPDPQWGERVVALCVAAPGSTLSAEALRERLRERLAGFKLPKEFRFLDDLPRTESGAVDRSKLSGL